jgi:hypothetical protein
MNKATPHVLLHGGGEPLEVLLGGAFPKKRSSHRFLTSHDYICLDIERKAETTRPSLLRCARQVRRRLEADELARNPAVHFLAKPFSLAGLAGKVKEVSRG